MKIALGSDHAGYVLKEAIKAYFNEHKIEYKDFGTFKIESCNYPEFSYKVSSAVASQDADRGILVCGTGIGMCITANKIKGIRAAQAYNTQMAQLSRQHNDANVLCLGARLTKEAEALEIVETWLNTSFEGGRHENRVKLITQLTGI